MRRDSPSQHTLSLQLCPCPLMAPALPCCFPLPLQSCPCLRNYPHTNQDNSPSTRTPTTIV